MSGVNGVPGFEELTQAAHYLSPTNLNVTSKPLKIGIIGFGTFGQFLTKTLKKQGHTVYAQSRSNYEERAQELGAIWVKTQDELTRLQLDVLILSMSILSFAEAVAAFPWSQLKNCLVVDVLSVKVHPRDILLDVLKKHGDSSLDILCTHPMFGPESGKYSWNGLNFMFDRVRISPSSNDRTQAFLQIFEREGCRMLEMTCELHDEYAAGSQFLTHTTGRILAQLGCSTTPINTASYSKLLQVIEQTQKDSWELYAGLYKYNAKSQEQLEKFAQSFDGLRTKLLESVAAPSSSSASSGVKFNPLILKMNEAKTVAVADLTKKLMSQGLAIISLAVGEILSQPTPKVICDASYKAMCEGKTIYTSANGVLELRQAICKKLQTENNLTYTPDQILVSNGAKQAIYQCLSGLVTPDENEVIVPAPYWVSYPEMATMVGGQAICVDTAADGYILTPEKLEAAITPRTKVLILCSPSNPTGIVYTKAQLEALASVLRRHPRVIVLSDEIYEHLLYDSAQHISFATLPDMFQRTCTINGFSKGYIMTGFRLGYLAGPTEIVKICNKIQGQITSCSSSISQYAGLAALTQLPADFRPQLVASLDKTRQLLLTELGKIPRVAFRKPNGAFYVLVDVHDYFGLKTKEGTLIKDSDDLAMYLLDRHLVALVPGSAFGAPHCLRISYASSDAIVLKGVQALAAGLQELQQ